MPRIHAFEFEDLPWFPASLRNRMTEYLDFMGSRMRGFVELAAARIEPLLAPGDEARVVDLGSGSGGALPTVAHALAEAGHPVRVTLTDRYPNREALERVCAEDPERFAWHPEPVDARAVPKDLPGVRTMFLSMHHFRPDDARAILADAARSRSPIAVFEGTERNPLLIVAFTLTVPLVVLLTAPFIKPFRWSRIFFSWVVPLLPFLIWWDGFVSHLRTYSTDELETLVAEIPSDDWRWDIRRERIPGTPAYCIHLVGHPT